MQQALRHCLLCHQWFTSAQHIFKLVLTGFWRVQLRRVVGAVPKPPTSPSTPVPARSSNRPLLITTVRLLVHPRFHPASRRPLRISRCRTRRQRWVSFRPGERSRQRCNRRPCPASVARWSWTRPGSRAARGEGQGSCEMEATGLQGGSPIFQCTSSSPALPAEAQLGEEPGGFVLDDGQNPPATRGSDGHRAERTQFDHVVQSGWH